MKDDILVSIIIPVYNAELVVGETIESAINQSYNNIEIIIVNDASTDFSVSIIERFKDKRIKLISLLTNIGAAACRNLGIINSKGSYFQFLDADDILPKNKIYEQIELVKKKSKTVLIGCYWLRFKNDIEKPIGHIHPENIKSGEIIDPVQWLIERPMMIPHTWLVSKKLILSAGLWDETLTLNDDGEFFYRIISKSSAVILSKTVVFYRTFQSSNLSSRNDRDAMLSWIKTAENYEKIIHKLDKERSYPSIENFYFQIAYACLNKHDDLSEFCANKLSYKMESYNTNILFVEEFKNKIGLKKAKKLHDFVHNLKNNKILRKVLGKK